MANSENPGRDAPVSTPDGDAGYQFGAFEKLFASE